MSEITRETFKVDAKGKVLGRLATEIAFHLIGKHKPSYQPNIDAGDFVEVVNVADLSISEKKLDQKIYYHHSLHPGGIKQKTMREVFENDPAEVLRKAVYRMLPKNKLARQMFSKLKVYAGAEHPHTAQKPQELKLG